MKILLLADYYSNYLTAFYKKNNLDNLSYKEHKEKLLDDYFGSFVSYYRYFNQIGYECELLIANDYKLQEKWLKENNINIKAIPENKHKIVLLQTQQFIPDIFFMGSMFDYYGKFLKDISEITKNIFTWISCPYSNNLDFSNIRCVISSSTIFVENFRDLGLNSQFLKAAFDKDILNFIEMKKQQHGSFIGSLSETTHKNRVDSLITLLNKDIPLEIFGYGLQNDFLQNFYKSELWGMEMYNTLANSKFTLNFQIDVGLNQTGNMRLYEATGCGTLLFTEQTKNIEKFFIPNKEIITFKNIDELYQKIKYYLNNPYEAKEIAKLGQERCLTEHSYDTRIKDFDKILLKYTD